MFTLLCHRGKDPVNNDSELVIMKNCNKTSVDS